MNQPFPACHRLGPGEFLHLRGQAVRLRAERGSLWVTQDGEPDDVLLEPGETHDFAGAAPLVIGSFGDDALVRVTPLQPARAAPAPWRAWLGAVTAGVRP